MAGGSSVGGGGDSEALMVKLTVLNQILKNDPRVSLGFYPLFAEINFEPISGPYIEIEYHLAKGTNIIRGAPKGNGYAELLTIKFPQNKINSEVINKIGEIVLSLVPTNSSVNSHLVRAARCTRSGGIVYPQTADPTLLFMQIEKTSFLLNCASESGEVVHIIGVFKD